MDFFLLGLIYENKAKHFPIDALKRPELGNLFILKRQFDF